MNKLRKQFGKECGVNPAYFTERYLEWLEEKLSSANQQMQRVIKRAQTVLEHRALEPDLPDLIDEIEQYFE